MEATSLDQKIRLLPESLQAQVADFIDFLLQKNVGQQPGKKSGFGSGKTLFTLMPDFDEPLKDFEEQSLAIHLT